jgi:RHS repeat-associated protein
LNAAIRYVSDVNVALPVTIDDGTRKYVYGMGLAFDVTGSSLEIYHPDRLGSVRALTNSAGTVIAGYRSDEYGILAATSGSSAQPFGFTGEPRDTTGLTYLRTRYYDPSLGRLTSRDRWLGSPHVCQTLNRYLYALNDPATFVDPSGLKSRALCAGYRDINFTGGALGVITTGIMWNDAGWHFYLGSGVGIGFTGAFTCSSDPIQKGWNYGGQATCVGAFQAGGDISGSTSYREFGLGWPGGVTFTAFYVFEVRARCFSGKQSEMLSHCWLGRSSSYFRFRSPIV